MKTLGRMPLRTRVPGFSGSLMLAFLAGLVFPLPGATAASPGEPEGSLIAVDYAALIGGADLDFKVPLGPGAERGLPIGNGRVGTLLWTRPEQSKLHMQLNHTDVFAFRNSSAATLDAHAFYCNGCGFVDIDVGDDVFGDHATSNHLAVYDAVAEVSGRGVRIRAFAWNQKDVIAVEITDEKVPATKTRQSGNLPRFGGWHLFPFFPGRRLAVGHHRHPPGDRREHVAGPAHRPLLEGLAAGEHQHHEHTGEVFAEQDARDDRDAGEEVGAERAGEELREQIPDERDAAEEEHRHQRQVGQREATTGKPARGIERPERHRPAAEPRPGEHGPGSEREDRAHGDRLIHRERLAGRRPRPRGVCHGGGPQLCIRAKGSPAARISASAAASSWSRSRTASSAMKSQARRT